MIRLSKKARDAAIENRPGSRLVKHGDNVFAVWQDKDAPTRERWHGQVLKGVDFLRGGVPCVWWLGAERTGRTRGALIEALVEEAS